MSPLEFMQWLAALVPRPRLHLIRFHGVLAPNAKLRTVVVPQEAESPAQQAKPAEGEANCMHHRPVRLIWAKLLKRVLATTSLEYKLVFAEASLSISIWSTARTAAAS